MKEFDYDICIGPIALPSPDGYVLVRGPTEHSVRGAAIKVLAGETSFFQIVDRHGAVQLSIPAHMLVYCKARQTGTPELAAVPSINAPPIPIKIRRKRKTE